MKHPWQKAMQNHHTTREEFIAACVVDAIVLTALLVFLLTCASWAVGAELVPGAVIATRNADESLNTSPGTLNHLSIYVGNGEVIESQAGQGVIKTKLADFLARDYETPLVLLPKDRDAGERAAEKAATLVGYKFAKASSIFRRTNERRGANCVSVVKESWGGEYRKVRRLHIPDDIFKLKEVFEPARRLVKPADSTEPEAGHVKASELRGAGDRFGWFTHRPRRSVNNRGILHEMLSRCPQWCMNQIRSMDRVTQCHEATHGVNHELSQHFGQMYGAFYVGNCRYVVLPCPTVTVGQVARYVPQEQRTPRYTLYLTGDRVARNCLTLLDEWTCYANDAQCTKELGLQTDGGLKFANEFSGFVDTTVETIRKHDTSYDLEPLTRFVDWQKQRVEELSK